MPYAKVNDLEIYYELHGPDGAEPLVLFNGAFGVVGENSDWSNQVARFAQEYRVLIFEHRGHGRTKNPAGKFTNYAELADDAVGLMRSLNIPKATLAGFSDGGITLLELARRYPEMIVNMVVVGANYYNDADCLKAMETLIPENIEQNYPDWAATLEKQHGSQGRGYWKELARQLREMWLEYPNFSQEDLSRITVPALVMSGQYDHFGSIRQTLDIHRSIKGSEICIVPGAAHPVLSQRPEITGLLILDYLVRQRKRRTRASHVSVAIEPGK